MGDRRPIKNINIMQSSAAARNKWVALTYINETHTKMQDIQNQTMTMYSKSYW